MGIGFIGAGNMASAIIKGILEKDVVKPADIFLYDISTEKREAFAKEVGATACSSAEVVIKNVNTVLLCVKPNHMEQLGSTIQNALDQKKPLVISIAAGITLDSLFKYFCGQRIVRVMPNVNALVGSGAAAVCGNSRATKEDIDYVLKIFNAVGKAWELPRISLFPFHCHGRSGPAFALYFIDSLARAGVKNGMPKDLCDQIASQVVLGSGQMVLETGESPFTWIDRVCSPGGTTVAGLLAMQEASLGPAVVKGIDAAIAQDKKLGE